MLPEPVREIKRARQYQQIMIRQRFIENTPHQRGGTSRFFHAHAYAENTSDIIVVGRTAMSRTRHARLLLIIVMGVTQAMRRMPSICGQNRAAHLTET